MAFYRGDSFRPVYGRLPELRSLVGDKVRFVAMTATADQKTRLAIMDKLHMSKALEICKSPERSSIFYGLLKDMPTATLAKQLSEGLLKHRQNYPKTLVFCRK